MEFQKSVKKNCAQYWALSNKIIKTEIHLELQEEKRLKAIVDGRTDRRTDGQTDGQTDAGPAAVL